MEGKEVRFGIFNSALFAATTTATGCGAVNSMHDSFTPLGGLIPLFNIQLGEVVFGGVGAGLYGMLVYVAVTVFIAGLMIGRTPEYLGQKSAGLRSEDGQFLPADLCRRDPRVFTAWGVLNNWGPPDPVDACRHRMARITMARTDFSEILYAFSEAAGQQRQRLRGTQRQCALVSTPPSASRFCSVALRMMVPVLAIAGSLARKKVAPPGPGTFPVTGVDLCRALIGVVLLVGALNFLPDARPRPDCRTLPNARRQIVLTRNR